MCITYTHAYTSLLVGAIVGASCDHASTRVACPEHALSSQSITAQPFRNTGTCIKAKQTLAECLRDRFGCVTVAAAAAAAVVAVGATGAGRGGACVVKTATVTSGFDLATAPLVSVFARRFA